MHLITMPAAAASAAASVLDGFLVTLAEAAALPRAHAIPELIEAPIPRVATLYWEGPARCGALGAAFDVVPEGAEQVIGVEQVIGADRVILDKRPLAFIDGLITRH